MEPAYRKRRELLRRRMVNAGVAGLVVTHAPNVFYLCGFSGSAGILLLESRGATLVTDSRYALQAREEVQGGRVHIARGGLLCAIGERLRLLGRGRVAFEAARLTVSQIGELRRAAGAGIRWMGIEDWVEDVRAVKGPHEIARMRAAARLGSAVFQEVLPLIKPEVREFELAAEIDYRMRRRGASSAAFETIVASGARAALPHARATSKALRKNELVVLDLGAILRGYCCDLTRTVYLGRAPSTLRQWYAAVLEAQVAARHALRPGAAAAEVDAAARRVLRRSGLLAHVVHSIGHGLGLEVHEAPRLAPGQSTRLRVGNVVTLEPGVYAEGIGGIRVEDDVVILARGTEVLTDATREFLEL